MASINLSDLFTKHDDIANHLDMLSIQVKSNTNKFNNYAITYGWDFENKNNQRTSELKRLYRSAKTQLFDFFLFNSRFAKPCIIKRVSVSAAGTPFIRITTASAIITEVEIGYINNRTFRTKIEDLISGKVRIDEKSIASHINSFLFPHVIFPPNHKFKTIGEYANFIIEAISPATDIIFPSSDMSLTEAVNMMLSSIYMPWDVLYYSDLNLHGIRTDIFGGLSIIHQSGYAVSSDLIYDMQLETLKYLWQLNMELKNCESIKSAKAAIMSRNISHNLGSHVMAYLKHNLGSVSDIVKQRVLADLSFSDSLAEASTSIKKWSVSEFTEDTELPFLVGLGHFLSYIQERQDYIATVATTYVPYYMTVNFKDMVYDNLNPDLRHLRHDDRKGGRPENILLSYIAKSENFGRPPYLSYKNISDSAQLKPLDQVRRKSDIVIKYGKFDGINDALIKDEDKIGIQVRKPKTKGIGFKSLAHMREVNIGLPGGVSGRQAIFSIFENIIRNTAKHGDFSHLNEDSKRLELKIDIIDLKNSSNNSLGRNISSLDGEHSIGGYLSTNGYYDKKDSNDIFVMTITDNANISQSDFDKLETGIIDKYIDDSTGEMKNQYKGLKEIRISAAWIRRIVDEDVVEKDDLCPIVKVRRVESGEGVFNLQYVICVPKAVGICVIVDKPKSCNSDKIKYLTIDEFNSDAIFNRGFDVIVLNGNDKNAHDDIYLKAHQRVIFVTNNEYKTIIGEASEDEKLTMVYRNLIPNAKDPKQTDLILIKDDVCISGADNSNDSGNLADDNNNVICKNIKQITGGVEGGFANKYLYLKHLESEKEFTAMIGLLSEGQSRDGILTERPIFAEGISGGNSTDRLVRGTQLDNIWYYKHMRAMKRMVAIVDERLFHHVTKVNDSQLLAIPVNGCIEGDYLSAVNAFKNVFLFNIVKVDDKLFKIYSAYTGYKYIDEKVKTVISLVGYITYEDNRVSVKLDNAKVFDNLSIHQGILDKLYRTFNIESKEQVTLRLYGEFMSGEPRELNAIENNGLKEYTYVYPGMTIHSGRSKPSKVDMPQLIPFIQYASIENAFMDCKYSLVELLELVQYE